MAKVVVGSVVVGSLVIVAPIDCGSSVFGPSSFTIIVKGNRELLA